MLTIMDLCSRRGLELRGKGRGKRGPEYSAPCPVCGGTDRFLVWPEQNEGSGSFACRQCGIAGDVLEWLMRVDGMTFGEARREAGLPGVAPRPACPRLPAQEERRGIVARPDAAAAASGDVRLDVWRAKATAFADYCLRQLTADRSAQAWLSARGLPPESWGVYCLGWHPGDADRPCRMRPRQVWGLPVGKPARKNGKPRTALWLPRGFVIPALSGEVVTRLRIRRPDADRERSLPDLKYYVVPGSDMTPTWLPQRVGVLPPGSCALVVENELDARACHWAAGDLTACMSAMTARIRELPESVMQRLRECAVILVATDFGDADGSGAKGWRIWAETFPQAKRWPVPAGKDAGQYYAQGGDLRAWIAAGLPDALARMASPLSSPVGGQGDAHIPDAEPRAAAEERQIQGQRAADQRAALREMYPLLHRVYGRNDVEAMRLCLYAHGLYAEPDGDDFRLRGFERWTLEERAPLIRFVHRYGALINKTIREPEHAV